MRKLSFSLPCRIIHKDKYLSKYVNEVYCELAGTQLEIELKDPLNPKILNKILGPHFLYAMEEHQTLYMRCDIYLMRNKKSFSKIELKDLEKYLLSNVVKFNERL